MIALGNELALSYRAAQVGSVVQVLTEEVSDGVAHGYTAQYIPCAFPGGQPGRVDDVTVTGLTDEGFSLCAAMTMGDDQTGMLWGRRFGTQKIKRHDDAGFCLQGMILCCEAGDFFCPEKCMHTLAGNAAGQACDFRKPLAQCFFPDSVGFGGFSLKGEFPFP